MDRPFHCGAAAHDLDETLTIQMTSMRLHTMMSVGYDACDGDKLESAINTMIDEDTEYRLRMPHVSD